MYGSVCVWSGRRVDARTTGCERSRVVVPRQTNPRGFIARKPLGQPLPVTGLGSISTMAPARSWPRRGADTSACARIGVSYRLARAATRRAAQPARRCGPPAAWPGHRHRERGSAARAAFRPAQASLPGAARLVWPARAAGHACRNCRAPAATLHG